MTWQLAWDMRHGIVLSAEYQPMGADPVSASAIAIKEGQVFTPSGKAYPFPVPRPLEVHEIPGVVKKYADGARNSLAAGDALSCPGKASC
jgi:2,4-dienoyl-CoA reductase-like NADH-dependent reductase (Old Yellow Enzyme family)